MKLNRYFIILSTVLSLFGTTVAHTQDQNGDGKQEDGKQQEEENHLDATHKFDRESLAFLLLRGVKHVAIPSALPTF